MSIYKGIPNLFFSGKYADLTIECGDREFKVHRAIVCTQSEVIARLCSSSDGAQECTINLPGEDPIIFSMFLSCIYRGNYKDVYCQNPKRISYIAAIPLDKVNYYLTYTGPTKQSWMSPETLDSKFSDLFLAHKNTTGDIFAVIGGIDSRVEDKMGDIISKHDKLTDYDLEGGAAVVVYQIRERIGGLVGSLRLYVMAHKYDVSTAKLLACERFWNISRNLIRDLRVVGSDAANASEDIYTGLAAVVDELYDNTTPLDGTMRRIAKILVSIEFRVPEFRDMILPVLGKHTQLAEDVRRYVLQWRLGFVDSDWTVVDRFGL